MRTLVLLRHAKAVRPEPGLADFDRGLEPRGRLETARCARLLLDLGLVPDLALVSPAKRTRDTWTVAAETLAAGAVEHDEAIYDADVGALLASIVAHDDVAALLLVGHNPGLKDVARALMGEGPHNVAAVDLLTHGLPTSCALVFGLDGATNRGAARLLAFIAPERDDDDA
jgi:phosphohistidine phosphatase